MASGEPLFLLGREHVTVVVYASVARVVKETRAFITLTTPSPPSLLLLHTRADPQRYLFSLQRKEQNVNSGEKKTWRLTAHMKTNEEWDYDVDVIEWPL